MGVSAIFMLVIAGICGVFVNDIFTGIGWLLFNFYTAYTIFYHTIIIYFGYAVIISKEFYPNLKTFGAGILFVTIFFGIALTINLCCHANLMSMMPYRIQTKTFFFHFVAFFLQFSLPYFWLLVYNQRLQFYTFIILLFFVLLLVLQDVFDGFFLWQNQSNKLRHTFHTLQQTQQKA